MSVIIEAKQSGIEKTWNTTKEWQYFVRKGVKIMENKRIIYVAGPYRADTEYGVKQNIERAEKVAVKYWQAGYLVYCPHKNCAFLGGACPDEVWLDAGIQFLKLCDGIVMMEGWQDSSGSVAEWNYATKKGMTIFYEDDNDCLELVKDVLK